LPPPAVLEAYNSLVQDGAERVFRQFETEAEHRRTQEREGLREAMREGRAAQFLAGLFAFSALGITVYAISVGAFTVAAIVGGATLVGVVGAFLYRQRQ